MEGDTTSLCSAAATAEVERAFGAATAPFSRCCDGVIASVKQTQAIKKGRFPWRRCLEFGSMFYQHLQNKSAKHQDRAHSRIVLAMAEIQIGRKTAGLFIRCRAGAVGREPGQQ